MDCTQRIEEVLGELQRVREAHAFWAGHLASGRTGWRELDAREELRARRRVQCLESELVAVKEGGAA